MRVRFLVWLIRMMLMLSFIVMLTCAGVALKTHGAVVFDSSVTLMAVAFFIGSYAVVTFEHRWTKRRLTNFLLESPAGPTVAAEALTNPTWPRVTNSEIELARFYREVTARFDESMQDSDGDTARMVCVFVTPAVAGQLRTLAAARSADTILCRKNVSSAA